MNAAVNYYTMYLVRSDASWDREHSALLSISNASHLGQEMGAGATLLRASPGISTTSSRTQAFPEKQCGSIPWPNASFCRTVSLTEPLTLCWDAEDNEVLGKHQNCVLITPEGPQLPQAMLGRIEKCLFCTMKRQATLMITDQCPEHDFPLGFRRNCTGVLINMSVCWQVAVAPKLINEIINSAYPSAPQVQSRETADTEPEGLRLSGNTHSDSHERRSMPLTALSVALSRSFTFPVSLSLTLFPPAVSVSHSVTLAPPLSLSLSLSLPPFLSAGDITEPLQAC
ncbi:hypothetical protein DPX16_8075 [Anabarilius grahami]|uniref:Uncharacterized protein n=1 Tax=Anabarilius grahami TaxID=495550 RepID=A0A3N0XWD7_ANAGA|nr:hypothetical protein DPX16_8075 [Anabarilius grahami]